MFINTDRFPAIAHPHFSPLLPFFQPEWMKTKEYWDKDFENRYEKLQKDPNRPPLKVIIYAN